MKDKRSDDYYVEVPEGITKQQMLDVVTHAASAAGLYVSHLGGYSRTKYPNSIHWHFKRSANDIWL